MKIYTLTVSLVVSSFFSCLQAQVPDLGILTNFVLFTSAGAVGNTGISDITGDVGANIGAITGFESIPGTVYNGDATTAQAVIDVASAYNQLFNTPATFTGHTPAFGSGETLFAGVYSITAAGSVLGDLTLDAQGDPNAIFIFKFGGALTTAASTTIHLINSATAHNIFWISEGAISMAALTTIAGTFIANNGAIDMGAGSILEGRLLSTTGAVSVYGTQAFIPVYSVLSINQLSLISHCEGAGTRIAWAKMNSGINHITIQGSKDGFHWNDLQKINEGEKSWIQHSFLFANQSSSFFRVVYTKLTGKAEYGPILRVIPCTLNNDKLLIYPNPSPGIFHLVFMGNINEVYATTVIDMHGKTVHSSTGAPRDINISKLPTGIYVIRIQLASSQGFYTVMKL